jgi:hypothetical protein
VNSPHLQKAVLQLDVPVGNPLAVTVVQGKDQLLEEPASLNSTTYARTFVESKKGAGMQQHFR